MADVPNDAAVDTGAELASGTEVGGYVVDGKIGEGGMGVVYGAKQPRIGKRVAIKVLARAFSSDPGVVARFEQEARVVNEIKHPNIVDVFQFGELPDKRSYFVMEWLEGEPLTARIDRGAIPAGEAMEILDVIADALQAAHEKNVIHRDLKSDNVFLITMRGKRTVKLLDFGLAKLSGRGLEDAPVGSTKQGIVVGTPAYMSPEQARSQPVDGRTDVYALGCLAYKMLTGTLPFRGENAMDLIVQQLNAPPPQAIKLAPKTPPSLSKLIVKMMAKAPADRPSLQTIRELFAELRETTVPPRAKRETRGEEARTKRPSAKRDAQAVEERQEPTQGKIRLSLAEMENQDGRPEPAQKSKATPILIVVALLLVGVIAAVFIMMKKDDKSAAGGATDGSGSAVAAAGSGSAAGSANTGSASIPAAGSGSAAQPTIEFEDDKVARTGSGSASGTSSGSARAAQREADDKATEEAMAETPTIVNKPGKLVIMLQHPATIEIDGKAVAQNSKGGNFDVKPGDHTVRIVAENRETVNRSVSVEPGGSAVIRIVDDTEPEPQPQPQPQPQPPAEGSAATP